MSATVVLDKMNRGFPVWRHPSVSGVPCRVAICDRTHRTSSGETCPHSSLHQSRLGSSAGLHSSGKMLTCPQTLHHFTQGRSGEPAGRGQRSGPRSGLHGAADGAVQPAAHQPRQPAPVQARERPLQAGYDRGNRQQAPLWQPAAPVAGLGVHGSSTHPEPGVDSGRLGFGFMRKLDIYSTSGEKYTRLRR